MPSAPCQKPSIGTKPLFPWVDAQNAAACPLPAIRIEPGERFLCIGEVLEKTSFRSKTTIYDMERSGEFPSRISLFGRRVAWLESEVLAWMASRVDLRNNSTKQDKK